MKRNLKSLLKGKLKPQELDGLAESYDIVGDIAIVRVPENLKSQSLIIAEAIMQTPRHVKTVLRQASAISGEFRLRQLEWITGEKKLKPCTESLAVFLRSIWRDAIFRLAFHLSGCASQSWFSQMKPL